MATEQWKENHVADLRLYRRRWYRNNSTSAKQRVVERRRELKRHIALYKAQKGCAHCPERHPACLQFHHDKGEKEICVSRAVNLGWSIERIEEEIEKCTVLCANCHLKLHAEKLASGVGIEPTHGDLESLSPALEHARIT